MSIANPRVTQSELAAGLEAARARSLSLLDPLSEANQLRQHSRLMSPLIWDLGHVANYEEIWLLRALDHQHAVRPDLDVLYDAFIQPRHTRPKLPMLGPVEVRAYAAEVRERVLDVLYVLDRLGVLHQADLADLTAEPGSGADRALLGDGFVYRMVIQHEHQHDETMLATLQLMSAPGYRPLDPAASLASGLYGNQIRVISTKVVPTPPGNPEVLVDGGPFVMGTSTDPWALDNERPAHVVDLPDFFIDTTPVTNAAYAEFVADGGYRDPRLWTETGWAWREKAGLAHPEFWYHDGGWLRDRFGWVEPLPGLQPVQHVCWYEADAYARWAGRRLPTEAEWEKAASWGRDGRKRRWPWGNTEPADARANLGQNNFGPSAVGSYPSGVGPWGAHQLVGDVWEWTASDFAPYPGFASRPYREYSEVFFGSEYKVLRGGSWATDPTAMRTTFRNWDYPIRRQIFAGFRCARDA